MSKEELNKALLEIAERVDSPEAAEKINEQFVNSRFEFVKFTEALKETILDPALKKLIESSDMVREIGVFNSPDQKNFADVGMHALSVAVFSKKPNITAALLKNLTTDNKELIAKNNIMSHIFLAWEAESVKELIQSEVFTDIINQSESTPDSYLPHSDPNFKATPLIFLIINRNNDGHSGIDTRRKEVLTCLLSSEQIDVNVQDSEGNTALDHINNELKQTKINESDQKELEEYKRILTARQAKTGQQLRNNRTNSINTRSI